MEGTWRKGPGKELFDALEKKIGKLPILAEDLGVITSDVCELRWGALLCTGACVAGGWEGRAGVGVCVWFVMAVAWWGMRLAGFSWVMEDACWGAADAGHALLGWCACCACMHENSCEWRTPAGDTATP